MENKGGNVLVAIFFLILPIAVALGITGLFGGSLSQYFPEIDYWKGFWSFNLIAGIGWIVQLVLAISILRNELRADYIGYLLTVVMSSGLFLLIPYLLFSFIVPMHAFWIPITFIVGSFIIMLYRHYVKVSFLGISQAWTLAWVACLWIPPFLIGAWLI